MLRAVLIPAALWLFAGCASTAPKPISVGGAPPSVAELAGQWDGQYRTVDGGRRGTIRFDLAKGDTVATGNVFMSTSFEAPMSPGAGAAPPGAAPPRPATEALSVNFVQVDNGLVRGRLAPYTDPDCGCTVDTVFDGRVNDDRIEGTFTIKNTLTGTTREGRWSVQRHAPDVPK
jgi:hypothetical protein